MEYSQNVWRTHSYHQRRGYLFITRTKKKTTFPGTRWAQCSSIVQIHIINMISNEMTNKLRCGIEIRMNNINIPTIINMKNMNIIRINICHRFCKRLATMWPNYCWPTKWLISTIHQQHIREISCLHPLTLFPDELIIFMSLTTPRFG